MKKLTFEQIIEKLKSVMNIKQFAYEDYFPEEIEGIGEVSEVDKYGGEGQGETWYSVKHFKDHNVYIKVSGYYSSYDGVAFEGWEDCIEVKPVEKTITVYD